MYSVRTDRKRYAVKALNPQVMLRPEALGSIIESERIAAVASRQLPAAPALAFNGLAVQELEGQHYLIFDWIDGVTLSNNEIAVSHCAMMGSILAALHKINFGDLCSIEGFSFEEPTVDWRFYLQMGIHSGAVWVDVMNENIGRLEAWSMQLERAVKILAAGTVVSHRDLEPKNVMWSSGNLIIIDWEAAGHIHPAHDMVETAVYWSRAENGRIDEDKFKAFISAYKHIYGLIAADWVAVLNRGFSSLSGWLEYSLKRSLGIECCDATEQQMGTEHVVDTVRAASLYFETVPLLHKWLIGLT